MRVPFSQFIIFLYVNSSFVLNTFQNSNKKGLCQFFFVYGKAGITSSEYSFPKHRGQFPLFFPLFNFQSLKIPVFIHATPKSYLAFFTMQKWTPYTEVKAVHLSFCDLVSVPKTDGLYLVYHNPLIKFWWNSPWEIFE
jgi:hypothetical protein